MKLKEIYIRRVFSRITVLIINAYKYKNDFKGKMEVRGLKAACLAYLDNAKSC